MYIVHVVYLTCMFLCCTQVSDKIPDIVSSLESHTHIRQVTPHKKVTRTLKLVKRECSLSYLISDVVSNRVLTCQVNCWALQLCPSTHLWAQQSTWYALFYLLFLSPFPFPSHIVCSMQ